MSGLFLKILNMSISASWLVLAVLLIRLVFKRAPKWVNVLLWGIVALRLIFPFSVESALSLIPSAETIPMDIEMAARPAIDSGVQAINSVVNPMISESFTPNPLASANPLQIWIPLTAILWIAGMAGMLLYTVFSYWRLRRKVSEAVRLRDNIFQSENVGSPFVLGVLRPKIYLPYNMDGQNLEHVVAHEQAHIRRRDHWWKPLGFLLLTIYWFNPLLWLAYVLLCRDIELACDEKVIRELGCEQRADYTQALLACSVSRRAIAACPLAFGEVGVKARVKSVLDYKKPAFWIIVLAVVVCVAVALCFLTDPATSVDAELAELIEREIAAHHRSAQSDENLCLQNWKVIGKTRAGDRTTVYMWVLYKEFSYEGEKNMQAGAHILTAITAERQDDGYEMTEYWQPADGAYYGSSIREKVPLYLWGKAMDSQRYIDEQNAALAPMIERHFGLTNEVTPDTISFEAEILAIYDGSFLVKPEDSWALNSADQIEVPMRNMNPSPEPQVGDIIEVVCSGEILETYPARLQEVYSIRVVTQFNSGAEEKWDLIPMLRVNGVLYLDTGHNNPSVADDAAFDGEITSAVDGSERPTADDQSNFGSGYGYRFGEREGTVELYMNGKWRIYATEEVRQEIQFPEKYAVDEGDLLEAFRSSISGDETVIVTDCVLAPDGAYGLDGVVQYADETGTPWKLAFIRDGAAFPASQDWGGDYAVASALRYLGDGVVQVCLEKLTDGTFYVCEMGYSYDKATKQTHFKFSSEELILPITADFASDALLSGKDYHEALTNDSEYAVKLLFRANEALTDVYFSALSYEDGGKIGEEKLLSVPELRPDNPLVVSVVFYGDMTTYGISFTDADGNARHFAVSLSGRDGSVVLREYMP